MAHSGPVIINTLRKIFGEKPLNGGDFLHIIEFSIVGMMLLYSVYSNSKEVPGIKETLLSTQTRVAVLETGQNAMKDALGNIQNSLGRIENVLLNNGGGRHR